MSQRAYREWRYVAAFTLFVLVVTTAPYAAAWNAQGDSWRFGGSLFGAEDGNAYLGKMRLGARGLWEFYLFYTSEIHADAPLFYLPYIATGQIVGRLIPPDDPRLAPALMIAFHGLRAACNAVLIAVMYAFIAAFTPSVKTRRLALTLAAFGGGLGWLLALTGNNGVLGSLPIDVYVPEGFSLLVLFGLPHIALGRAALLGLLLALVYALRVTREGRDTLIRGSKRWLVVAIVCGWIVALAVPFYLALTYALLGAWGLAAWIMTRRFPTRLFVCAVIVGAGTLPIFAYFYAQFTLNDAFSVWSSQNSLPSPHPLHYVFGYGVLALAAWAALRRVHPPRLSLLIGWLGIVPLLVYAPINVQRRLSEAVIVPLAILAALGLRVIGRHWRFGRAIRLGLTSAALLTSIFLLIGGMLAASNPGRPLFRPASEIAAFDWLAANAPPDAVILAAPETGNGIPVYTSLRTYMGHGPETLFWQDKTGTLTRFYRDELSATQRAELLYAPEPDSALWFYLPIRYVFYGERERAIAPQSPAWTDGLRRVYDVDGVQIYEVPPP